MSDGSEAFKELLGKEFKVGREESIKQEIAKFADIAGVTSEEAQEATQILLDHFKELNTKQEIPDVALMPFETYQERVFAKMTPGMLPVYMTINGVKKEVGSALFDPRSGSYCIVHAIVDGEAAVAALLNGDKSGISIGNTSEPEKVE